MNIFVLDADPKRAAVAHCDKHVVKMILELAQMMSTAHHLVDGADFIITSEGKTPLYKPTHANHPMCQWVRTSSKNYEWAFIHFNALCKEYEYRYNKIHQTYTKLNEALAYTPLNIMRSEAPTPIPQCMPEQYKVPGDPVAAYRAYYIGEKADFAKWSRRDPPEWWPK